MTMIMTLTRIWNLKARKGRVEAMFVISEVLLSCPIESDREGLCPDEAAENGSRDLPSRR